MAGFFGLFNYEKEGPGISKNAPKKKTFIVFFETFFRNFWKFITINLVYDLISVPVLTNGLAITLPTAFLPHKILRAILQYS